MKTDTKIAATPALAVAPCSAFQDAQHELDWKVFASVFSKWEGFEPNLHDSRAKELFFWFTCGAHHEMQGRLTIGPNTKGSRAEERE